MGKAYKEKIIMAINADGYYQPVKDGLQQENVLQKYDDYRCLCQKLFPDYKKTSQHNLKYFNRTKLVFRVFKGFSGCEVC